MLDEFTQGLLTGFAIQDAIFIFAAAVLGPYFTLWWIQRSPAMVARVLRAMKKHPEVRKEIVEILVLADQD